MIRIKDPTVGCQLTTANFHAQPKLAPMHATESKFVTGPSDQTNRSNLLKFDEIHHKIYQVYKPNHT